MIFFFLDNKNMLLTAAFKDNWREHNCSSVTLKTVQMLYCPHRCVPPFHSIITEAALLCHLRQLVFPYTLPAVTVTGNFPCNDAVTGSGLNCAFTPPWFNKWKYGCIMCIWNFCFSCLIVLGKNKKHLLAQKTSMQTAHLWEMSLKPYMKPVKFKLHDSCMLIQFKVMPLSVMGQDMAQWI